MKRTFLYILAALLAASCKNSSVKIIRVKAISPSSLSLLSHYAISPKPLQAITSTLSAWFPKEVAGNLTLPPATRRSCQEQSLLRIGSSVLNKTWMDKLTDNAPHLQFFDTSRGIDLIYDSSHAHHHHDADEPHAHDSIQDDEHQHLFWCGTTRLEFCL